MSEAFEKFLCEAHILIVDDEFANVRLLEASLEEDGHAHVLGLTDSRQVLAKFSEFQPDLSDGL
jgi:PleD family two-component response regulator